MVEDCEFYWQVLDVLEDGVYFTNGDRKITYWNKGAEKITGYSPGEVLGKFCRDNILNHEDKEGNSLCEKECPLSKTIKTGNKVEEHIILQHKNGTKIAVFVKAIPVRSKSGKIIGAAEIFSKKAT